MIDHTSDFPRHPPRRRLIGPALQRRLAWLAWLVTWLLLLAGPWLPERWLALVAFSAMHAGLFLWLRAGDLGAFPVQVRVGFALWVFLGATLPLGEILLVISAFGLAANLWAGYCPMARMVALLPWNRSGPLSAGRVLRTFVAPRSPGRFVAPP